MVSGDEQLQQQQKVDEATDSATPVADAKTSELPKSPVSIEPKQLEHMETISEEKATTTSEESKPAQEELPEEKPTEPPKSEQTEKSDEKPIANVNGIKKETKTEFKPAKKEHEEDDQKEKSEFSSLVLIVKIIVIIFDIITFPIYYLLQRPWIKLEKQRKVKAVLEDPNDPYSSYVRVIESFNNHYVFKANTVVEAQQLSLKLNPKNHRCLGFRRIKNVFNEKQKNGKDLMKYDLSDYEWLTISQVDTILCQLTRGFLHEGLKYKDLVLIFSETRLEWFLCASAIWRFGGSICTLYATLGTEAILYGINETEVEYIVTTTDLLPLLLKIIKRAKKVKKIFVIDVHSGLLKGKAKKTENDFNAEISDEIKDESRQKIKLVKYDQLLTSGFVTKDEDFEICRPKTDDIAIILYTSGSTGVPKGVVYSHSNLKSSMNCLYTIFNEELVDDYDQHTYYAILPLAHIFELLVELVFFCVGIRFGYGSPHTMTDASTAIIPGQKGDLKMLKPTLLVCVPLLLDRIRKTVTSRYERKKGVFWKQLIKFLIAYKNYWLERGFDTPLVNNMICVRLNGNLGGNVRFVFCGAAPLSPDTHKMMRALLNVQVLQGYGATELSGGATGMDLSDLYVGRIGSVLKGVKIRLIDWPEGGYSVHDKPNPRGEIVVSGPIVTQGYFKLPEKTKESFGIDKDGNRYFKTGDIGEVDKIGTFKIIDRKKDLVKLQFGEYISLGKVESELKTTQFVDNVCVYCDSTTTYTIALIQPTRASLKFLAQELNKSELTFEQQCDDKEINENVLNKITKHCLEAGLHRMEIPKKILLCKEEWTLDNNLMTASMKIKRKEIQNYYQKCIDEMYGRNQS